jgi:hypothetical protein
MKYTSESAQQLTPEELIIAFAHAHMNSVGKTDPNLSILKEELLKRLQPLNT